MRRVGVTLFVAALLGASLGADNWPQWRGPSGTGVTSETALPVRWSDDENVAWRVDLPGPGVSGPVVWGDRVFVTGQRGAGDRRPGFHPSLVQRGESGERNLTGVQDEARVTFLVSALSWADGSSVWQHEVPAEGALPQVHDKHNLATASPVTDGEVVVAWFGTGQAVALDAATGRRLWAKHLAREYSPFEINWGHSSSPVLHGDLAIFLCYHEPASYLLAVNKRTGEVVWKRDRTPNAHSYSTPLVLTHDGRATLVVNASRGLEAYDPATGAPRWHVREDNRFPIPMPVHDAGVLYASRGYRSSPYLAVKLGGEGDVTDSHVLWHTPTGAPYVSSLVFVGGRLYMASELGIVSVLDAATGKLLWRERVGGVYTASPVAGDGKVYFVSENGGTVVLDAGPTPSVLARNTVDAHIVASPAISRGRIFLRGDDELIAIGR